MLRGLAIRRAFVFGERLLILGVAAGVAAWYTGFLRYLPQTKFSTGSVASAIAVQPDALAGSLAQVKARADYEGLVTSGLFGDAAKSVQVAPPPPPPEPIE